MPGSAGRETQFPEGSVQGWSGHFHEGHRLYDLLANVRVIEGASFVAAPTCALHLQQLGAEVIRFDAIGGGPDFRRWPKAGNGASYYWEGLNKGKKSVALALDRPEGRDLAVALATAIGLLVTNYPAQGFLSHQRLARVRKDMITVRIMGWGDGKNALDYTVNAALGVPFMTGPAELGDRPVNHVLPAWDLITGGYAAFVTLAAERHRRTTGNGGEVRIPLGDVAIAALGSLGQFGEVTAAGQDRPRYGNDLYGAFGRDFETMDGARIMVTAISRRQWDVLVEALELTDAVQSLERALDVTFADDEGTRFEHRVELNSLVAEQIAKRAFQDLAERFERSGVTWGAYRTQLQALREDPQLSAANPILSEVSHLTDSRYLTPGSPASIPHMPRSQAGRAPILGEHTEEVLGDILGLSSKAIGSLIDRGVAAGPAPDLIQKHGKIADS